MSQEHRRDRGESDEDHAIETVTGHPKKGGRSELRTNTSNLSAQSKTRHRHKNGSDSNANIRSRGEEQEVSSVSGTKQGRMPKCKVESLSVVFASTSIKTGLESQKGENGGRGATVSYVIPSIVYRCEAGKEVADLKQKSRSASTDASTPPPESTAQVRQEIAHLNQSFMKSFHDY